MILQSELRLFQESSVHSERPESDLFSGRPFNTCPLSHHINSIVEVRSHGKISNDVCATSFYYSGRSDPVSIQYFASLEESVHYAFLTDSRKGT
jgi:hypothetical protein